MNANTVNKKILILQPVNGFGNRIRAIASGQILARKTKREFYLFWEESQPNDKFYTPKYDSVFKAGSLPQIPHIPEDAVIFAGGHKGEQVLIPEIKKCKADAIVIKAGGIFVPDDETTLKEYNNAKTKIYNSFQYIDRIQQAVDDFCDLHFKNNNVLGVHIRRSDRSKHTGPTMNFLDKMIPLLQRKKNTTNNTTNNSTENSERRSSTKSPYNVIFLCTDDKQEERTIENYINEQNTIFDVNIVTLPKNSNGRETKEQYIEAVIDWLLLSRTNRIIFSKGSSFGYEACFPQKLKQSIEIIGTKNYYNKSKFPPLTF